MDDAKEEAHLADIACDPHQIYDVAGDPQCLDQLFDPHDEDDRRSFYCLTCLFIRMTFFFSRDLWELVPLLGCLL